MHEAIDTLICGVYPNAQRYIPNTRYVFVPQPDNLTLRVYTDADCVDTGYIPLNPHMMTVRYGFTDLRARDARENKYRPDLPELP